MTAPASQPLIFNPLDPAFRLDPYPVYERLRSEDRFHQSMFGAHVLTHYDDVMAVLRHPAASSDQMKSTQYQQFVEAGLVEARFDDGMRPFLFIDPPDHTRLRGLVQKAFTPKMVEALRPRVQAVVDGLLDQAAAAGSLEVVEGLAYPLPVVIICEMLGVPAADHEEFKGWSRELARSLDPDFGVDAAVLAARQAAADAFVDYFKALIATRREHPRDDLLSALIAAEEAGDRLNEEELLSTLILLLVAGHETTVNLIANGALNLLRHPDELARLRTDPDGLARSAVEEVLRFDPPVQMTIRVAADDIVLDGLTVKQGEQAVLLLAAANRDPEHFPDPNRFDAGRADNRHLAFSFGTHYCLGAPLARLEGQVALSSLARRFPHLAMVSPDVTYKENIVLRGLAELHVTV